MPRFFTPTELVPRFSSAPKRLLPRSRGWRVVLARWSSLHLRIAAVVASLASPR